LLYLIMVRVFGWLALLLPRAHQRWCPNNWRERVKRESGSVSAHTNG
jgi:hypothetical protein